MKKKHLKPRVRKFLLFFCVSLGSLLILLFGLYQYQISPVSSSSQVEEVVIPKGVGIKGIGKILKEKNLIRSELFFMIYVKANGLTNLQASTYQFRQNMSLEEITRLLQGGNQYDPNVITVTFKEGYNIRQIAEAIAKYTSHSYEETIAFFQDRSFATEMIGTYWFLTDEILDGAIFYPLEGYLFPDTYQFKNKDVTLQEIAKRMLDRMDEVLTEDQTEINKSKFSIHELLTLASIVELEGVGEEDRDMIAEVFYNRLEAGWSLGSDVTSCYGFQVDIKNCNDQVSYNTYNPYNTRSSQMAGKLPVGPICSPSKNSILGSITPAPHQYYYFVADKYKKVYFTKNEKEHQAVIQEIKKRGDWPW